MKKILMISINDIGSTASLGVTKKILGQYKAFQNLGCDVYNLCLENDSGVLIHDNNKIVLFSKQIKTYLAYIKLFGMASKICEEKHIELCYIRYPLADWVFMKMIKRLYGKCKVYVEIPTYPYDREEEGNTNIIARINYFQDRIFRKRVSRYINKIVTYDDYKSIYHVPCIRIDNGIDVESVSFKESYPRIDNNIELVSVALMRPIHGYDRIIEGLKDYYSSENTNRIIRYNVVGDGSVLSDLKLLVEQYNLNDYVIFWGKQYGEKLDEIMSKMHIGFSVLAGHREGHTTMSDLKSREYCARGIPFVYSLDDSSFEGNEEYRMRIASDDSAIDINEIIIFADYIQSHPQIHNNMHQYAMQKLTWENQLKKIIEETVI